MSQSPPPTQHQQSSQQTTQRSARQAGQQTSQQPPQGQMPRQEQREAPARVQQSAPSGMYATRNILSPEVRISSIAALNHALADAIVLRSQLKAAHWNVKGPTFYQLHELFEDVAEMLDDHVDEIAERVTALGGEAPMTTRVAARTATVPEFRTDVVDGPGVLEQVADNLAAFDRILYRQIDNVSEQGDLDTADLLNEVSRDVSKSLWFVEAHLQGGQSGQQSTPQSGGQGSYMSM